MVLLDTPTSATGPLTQPQTISIDAMQRAVDLRILPVREAVDPF
jgi:hypothetical protein